MLGFNLIKEMSKADIIDELLESHRQHLAAQEIDALKVALINVRTELFRQRSIKEAGMQVTGNFMGSPVLENDDDD